MALNLLQMFQQEINFAEANLHIHHSHLFVIAAMDAITVNLFQKLFSIREFLKYNYDDRVTLYLNIPRKPCNPFLLDFREGVPSIEEHSRQLRERAMATNT